MRSLSFHELSPRQYPAPTILRYFAPVRRTTGATRGLCAAVKACVPIAMLNEMSVTRMSVVKRREQRVV